MTEEAHLILRHPESDADFAQRHRLLTDCLRQDHSTTYAIEEEYPFLLNRAASRRSYCLFSENQKLLAHTNLFERSVVHNGKQVHRIGVISNVATLASEQGKGYGKYLLQKLIEQCQQRNLDALLLWSELDRFYLSLGFEKFGREDRFTFTQSTAEKISLQKTDSAQLSLQDLSTMLKLRPSFPSAERTPEEFAEFLKTPDTHVLLQRKNNHINAYSIYGKGADMVNVVHEFGCSNQNFLADFVLQAAEHVRRIYGEAMVLARPGLFSFDTQKESHFMAWALKLSTTPLQDFFFWGLDSN